jgi:hypothetical protein
MMMRRKKSGGFFSNLKRKFGGKEKKTPNVSTNHKKNPSDAQNIKVA